MTLSVGGALVPLRIASVSAQTMRAWAGFLNDPNPIHLDRAAVQACGLGERLINQGPANLAYIISMLQWALPGARLRELDVRYVDNVFEGDAVEATGTITQVDDGVPQRLTCDVWLRAQGRGPVITGRAILEVDAGEPQATPRAATL